MRYWKGSIALSATQDYPLLRQVLRSTFITHRQLYDLLAYATISVTFRILKIGDDEYRIAVRSIVDGRRRQGNHRCALTKSKRNLDEHPRAKFILRVADGCLDLNIARRFVHDGIKRSYAPREVKSGKIVRRNLQRAPHGKLAGCPLRNAKVYVDRIQRL